MRRRMRSTSTDVKSIISAPTLSLQRISSPKASGATVSSTDYLAALDLWYAATTELTTLNRCRERIGIGEKKGRPPIQKEMPAVFG